MQAVMESQGSSNGARQQAKKEKKKRDEVCFPGQT